jgi:RHS repeat-associated protein
MKKRGFFYLKNTLILSVLLFLFISISPVFASQLNQTLTYDGNGNLITGDGKYREYNEFNQLLRVYDGSYSNGTILESYFYHPTENRILIKYGGYSSTTPDEAVVYVNDNLEKAYDGIRGTLSVNYTYYTFDENGLVGEIVKNNINTTLRTLYYHDDYSGSVSLITNGSGWVVEQTFYDPYGAILGGGNVSRYSYEGKEFSSVTDDFDFHFRKYDPSLMIFTQPDSVVSNVYDPQSLNRYSFEKNNPYKYVDKDGKTPRIPVKPFSLISNRDNKIFQGFDTDNQRWGGINSHVMPEIRKSLNDAWNSDDTVITAIRTSYYVIPYLSSGVSVLNWAVIEIRYQAFKDNRILGDTLKSSSSQDQLNKARNDAAWAGGSLGLEYFSNSNELVGAITTTSDLYSITNKGKNVFQEAYKYRKDIIKSISSEINKIFNKRGGSKESKSK